ncbi:RluA family pseudouridine synthase [Acetobacter garciniae]|uniref:RluA family pseudouridine synthase n=1 Tax=Acetobacter garciniae TaxID=2817435 RepID=UPI001E47D170|nr:RNA pseudouridine synthase [Acetobacter garciniae]
MDKPAGLPVHAGPAGGPSVEDWFPQLSRRRDGPWLAHRLDTDTSGCLAIALRKQPLVTLQQAFAAHRVHKTYWAVVDGGPQEAHGRMTFPLVKISTPAGWRMHAVDCDGEDGAGAENARNTNRKEGGKGVSQQGGKGSDAQAASTTWRVLGRGGGKTWLELTLQTGRTHQARVHCAAMGWPITGDALYGTAHSQGLHLLARSLSLPLSPVITAVAPPRAGMRTALHACGWQGDEDKMGCP